MIIDNSALVAMAMRESDAERLLTFPHGRSGLRISAANLLETYMVIDRRRGEHAAATIVAG